MNRAKVAVSLDADVLHRLDRLVRGRTFPSRSRAIEEAVREKLSRFDKGRLARECAKLDPREEARLAEEGLARDAGEWPAY